MESNHAVNGTGLQNEDSCTAEEEEGVFSINEYIEGLEAQELEVDMILGGDDGKECTYPKGYLPRQAVFSCITCCPEGNAGVCTACSMNCHDGHEVVELWTRRHFRCDCGNSKFGIGVCKLFSGKETENSENLYNQNFTGAYCTCKRPYPDPEVTEDQGEMLQCCICEDWFHEVHLGLAPSEEVPRDEDGEPLFEELICQACAGSLEFLSHYKEVLVPVSSATTLHKVETPAELSSAISDPVPTASKGRSNGTPACADNGDAVADFGVKVEEIGSSSKSQVINGVATLDGHHPQEAMQILKSTDASECDRILTNGGASYNKVTDTVDSRESEAIVCKLKSGEASTVQRGKMDPKELCGEDQMSTAKVWTARGLFLFKNWRSQLCRCVDCNDLYVKKGIGFLMNSEDTLSKYEEVAKEKRKEKMDTDEQDLSFLNSMSHVGKIEFLHGLNHMTSELSTFLASRESGKTVTSAEIYEFFDNLKKKRARFE